MPIIKRGDVYWLDTTVKGKRYRQSLATGERREATARAKELEQALWLGKAVIQQERAVSLSDAFTELKVSHYQDTKDYDNVCGRFQTLTRFISGDTPVTAIDRCAVDSLVVMMRQATYTRKTGGTEYPYSPTTVNRVLALLGFILNRMKDKGVLKDVPTMPKKREEGRTRFITEVEEEAMFSALQNSSNPNHQRCLRLFRFLTDTGCRMGEATGLEWQYVFWDHNLIVLDDTKSGKDVGKAMTDSVRSILLTELNEGHSKPFGGIGETMYRKAWEYAKKQAGLEDDKSLVRHSLRHTTASRLVQHGVSLKEVQEYLGHRNFNTTLRYAHLSPSGNRSALSVLNRVSGVCHSDVTENTAGNPKEIVDQAATLMYNAHLFIP